MPDVAPLLARPVPNDASGSAIERCIEGGHLVQQGEHAQIEQVQISSIQLPPSSECPLGLCLHAQFLPGAPTAIAV